MNKFKGFFAGLLSSASFGLIPLFALPLLKAELMPSCILFYRHIFAGLLIALMLLYKKLSFKISGREVGMLMLCGLLYYCSAFLLFTSYRLMSTGLATTLHFLYPVFVALIMGLFFKQKVSPFTMIAIVLALLGISLLSQIGSEVQLNLWAVIIAIASGLAYALYIVLVNNVAVLREMNNMKLTFYTMSFCTCLLLGQTLIYGEMQLLSNASEWSNVLLLAIIPTLVSNLALIRAIKLIGSTLTSVLGAMEPVVAMLVGIFVFGEAFTDKMGFGVSLILLAVLLIILSPLLDQNIKQRLERFAQNKSKSQ